MLALALALELAATPGAPRLPSVDCLSCRGVLLAQDLPVEDRETELNGRIEQLNRQIRAVSSDWPPGAIIAAYFGYVLSPFALLGALMLPLALFAGPQLGALVVVGAVCLAVGVAGVGLLVAAVITGLNASEAAKEEKGQLVRERDRLQQELRELRRGRERVQPTHWPSPTLLAFASF
ncbi:MAG: hypothetical protein HYZ28_01300 [Myxococcales bacterium]|nr:hypothetical protein [Myxococcales bacterium]